MIYKILIVNDHLVVREGLKLIIETNPNFKVIGEAENGKIALEFIKAKEPDVILMDLMMPVMSGLDTLSEFNKRGISIPVIILTTYNEDALILQCMNLGAKGFLLKDMQRQDLFRTLESAVRHEVLLQPEVVSTLIAAKISNKQPQKKSPKSILTKKEVAIMKAVARGYRNKEIASDMEVSERTVKAHLTNIYQKLDVDSRSEAVAVSIENGIVDFKTL